MTAREKAEKVVMNPYTILTAVMGFLGTVITVGGTIGYEHIMEKFYHPFTVRLDKQIYQQKVLIHLGHTEEEIQEAYSKAAVEVYKEKRAARLSELGLTEEDFEDNW